METPDQNFQTEPQVEEDEQQAKYNELVKKADELDTKVMESLDIVERQSKGKHMLSQARKLFLEAAELAEKMGNEQKAKHMLDKVEDCDELDRRLEKIQKVVGERF